MIREIFAPFERVTYRPGDGNKAVYKVFRPTKHLFVNKKKDNGNVVGFRAWKMPDCGADERMGWRAFRRKRSWDILPIFRLIEKEGNIREEEMYQVFNMGIGITIVCSPQRVAEGCQYLAPG